MLIITAQFMLLSNSDGKLISVVNMQLLLCVLWFEQPTPFTLREIATTAGVNSTDLVIIFYA